MASLRTTILVLAVFVYSCSDQTQPTKTDVSFKTFEISYTDGWTGHFSFIVDSNRIYFAPQRGDTSYYGMLPDSIYKIIDNAFLKIRSDTNIRSKDNRCVDCSVVTMKIVTHEDTIRVNQTGDLDKVFYPVIQLLQSFIKNGNHQTIRCPIFLETQSSTVPLPVINDRYKPPKI